MGVWITDIVRGQQLAFFLILFIYIRFNKVKYNDSNFFNQNQKEVDIHILVFVKLQASKMPLKEMTTQYS